MLLAGEAAGVREALDRMWPLLSPAELLHDLFGSRALLRLAGCRLAVCDAVASGRIEERRIDESVRRILALKAKYGLLAYHGTDGEAEARKIVKFEPPEDFPKLLDQTNQKLKAETESAQAKKAIEAMEKKLEKSAI